MSREFWGGVVVGTLLVGTLAAVMAPGSLRRRVGRMGTTGRLVREGGRLMMRGAEAAVQRSRTVGRRLMAARQG